MRIHPIYIEYMTQRLIQQNTYAALTSDVLLALRSKVM